MSIVYDFPAIKRRMDEIAGLIPNGTIHFPIDAKGADASVSERIKEAFARGYARGGIIRDSKPYIVGERAPEVIVPYEATWVTISAECSGGGGGGCFGQMVDDILSPEGRAFMEKNGAQG